MLKENERSARDRLSIPLIMHFEVTYSCNLRCLHCYNPASIVDRSELSTSDTKRAVSQVADTGTRLLCFTGGEPLLRKDILDVISFAHERNVKVKLITNGSLIDAKIARRLALNGLDIAQVTLNSSDPVTNKSIVGADSFDKTIHAIKCLSRNDVEVAVNITALSLNIDSIENTVTFLYGLGVRFISVVGVATFGRAFENKHMVLPDIRRILNLEKNLEEIGKRYSDLRLEVSFSMTDSHIVGGIYPKPCSWGRSRGVISPQGYVLPCEASSCLINVIRFDNITKRDFSEIWSSSSALNMFRDPGRIQGKCRECNRLASCRGGCRVRAYLVTGDICAPDPVCKYESG